MTDSAPPQAHATSYATPDSAGWFDVVVASLKDETTDIRSFELVAVDGAPLPGYQPGAHIDIELGPNLSRQYSLCGDPCDRFRYLIAVKREAQSRGGSRHMHESIRVGDKVRISYPRNRFHLAPGATRHLLFAGGIGITPLLSMAYQLAAEALPFELHYFVRSHAAAALRETLASPRFASKLHYHVGIEPADIPQCVRACMADAQFDTHVYTCGPGPFIDTVVSVASETLQSSAVHFERFQAEKHSTQNPNTSFEIVLARSGAAFQVSTSETITSVLEANGFACSTSCGEGVCGTCLTAVLEGTPDHRDSYLTPEEQARNDEMCICVSRSLTPKLVLDL